MKLVFELSNRQTKEVIEHAAACLRIALPLPDEPDPEKRPAHIRLRRKSAGWIGRGFDRPEGPGVARGDAAGAEWEKGWTWTS